MGGKTSIPHPRTSYRTRWHISVKELEMSSFHGNACGLWGYSPDQEISYPQSVQHTVFSVLQKTPSFWTIRPNRRAGYLSYEHLSLHVRARSLFILLLLVLRMAFLTLAVNLEQDQRSLKFLHILRHQPGNFLPISPTATFYTITINFFSGLSLMVLICIVTFPAKTDFVKMACFGVRQWHSSKTQHGTADSHKNVWGS